MAEAEKIPDFVPLRFRRVHLNGDESKRKAIEDALGKVVLIRDAHTFSVDDSKGLYFLAQITNLNELGCYDVVFVDGSNKPRRERLHYNDLIGFLVGI